MYEKELGISQSHRQQSMSLSPIDLMNDRVDRFGADSDTALFIELLYAGELILKITAAAFVSAIENDRENRRYRLLHGLVRADGIGEWAKAIDEVLSGPTSQQLSNSLTDARRMFTERLGGSHWQYEVVRDLHSVLSGFSDSTQPLGDKVALRTWFQLFSETF